VSVIKSRRKRKQAGHWAQKGENGNSYSVLVGKTGEMRLRRSNCRWENNIKIDLKEKECEGLDWI
jgi:hypothetical protein